LILKFNSSILPLGGNFFSACLLFSFIVSTTSLSASFAKSSNGEIFIPKSLAGTKSSSFDSSSSISFNS